VTDETIRWHLSGRDEAGRDFVMGIYPMLLDETCFFLAADFDKECWREWARSATEAFLYRRLETLPETAGKFRLNVELPIPFDGWGRMEVDLLCADARLAMELDGAQHLSDPEAYRRDRRKDCLLQQNGYVVLRFLAEDVCKQLDEVLDTILRILANRRIH
jgi:very-short-patch-repair endonuclease